MYRCVAGPTMTSLRHCQYLSTPTTYYQNTSGTSDGGTHTADSFAVFFLETKLTKLKNLVKLFATNFLLFNISLWV